MIVGRRCWRSCVAHCRAAATTKATARASQRRKNAATTKGSTSDAAAEEVPVLNDNTETFYGSYTLENEAVFGKLAASYAGRSRPAAVISTTASAYSVGCDLKVVQRTAAAAAPVGITDTCRVGATADRAATRDAECSAADTASDRLSSADPLAAMLSYPLHVQQPQADTFVMPTLLADRATAVARRLPSVSAVLDETRSDEDKRKLEEWKTRMIAELGADGFQRLQEVTLRNGSNLHKNIELWLDGDRAGIDVIPAVAGHWQSLMSSGVLLQLSDVQALEHRMEHDQILYKGVVDCVASFRDVPSVIEWKTSKKPKHSLAAAYDYPVQVAAYIGLWNRTQLLSPLLPEQQSRGPIRQGVLVITYESGEAADILVMKGSRCSHYWRAWLNRLHAFWSARLLVVARHPSQ